MADHFEEMPDMTRSVGDGADFGTMMVPTPDGEIPCAQFASLSTAHITSPGMEPKVAIFVMDDAVGAYVLLPPEAARVMAMAIIRSADAADAGYGSTKQ